MPELKRVYVRPQALTGIALIETSALNARGAAQQTQRVPRDVGQQKRRDAGIVLGKFAFGDVTRFGDDAVGMGDRNPARHHRTGLFSYPRSLGYHRGTHWCL